LPPSRQTERIARGVDQGPQVALKSCQMAIGIEAQLR
jgi:hypothetical protein